ncbi:MAG: GlsB/YeaQ/YmgE family stress response membrane protein [Chthoniobacteraceae bacterium]
MLHILWSIIVGFIIGLIARAIMPGAQHMGFMLTTVVGIVGSIVGGFIGRLISKPKEGQPVHPAGLIMSVIGALIVLFVWGKIGM